MSKRATSYLRVRDPDTGRRRLLHRCLAAEFLGRPLLPEEVVHHRDGDRRNNSRANLLILPSQRYHAHIEYLLRCERRGQPLLFPEFLQPVQLHVQGSLFENVLLSPSPGHQRRSLFS